MSALIEIELDRRPLDAIPADVCVAGFFIEDRPLRAAAGRLDWRLCGGISEVLLSGQIEGQRGEALLLSSAGPVSPARVLLLGLGSRSDFALPFAQDVMRDAMQRCLSLQARRIAMNPLGIARGDFARHAAAILAGVGEAVAGHAHRAGADDPGPGQLELRLSVPQPQIPSAMQALEHCLLAAAHPAIALPRSERLQTHATGGLAAPRGRGLHAG